MSSLVELGCRLRDGRTSSRELTGATLRRIGERNPALNAFVLVDDAGAMRAADAADAELTAGHDRGPLHGVPVGVKDLIDVEGLPTTCGSASGFGTARAEQDAAVVARLRDAGAVIVGKTTLHEFAYGATGDRSAHGASRNPHDRRRMSGGSSGGSAVAVAGGLVPLAIGTDTVGSVRVPAALCGVAGLKPAHDTVDATGVWPLAPSLDHVGLFAATAADLALGYPTLTGADRAIPSPDGPIGVAWLPPTQFAATDARIATGARDRLVRAGLTVSTVDAFTDIGPQLLDVAMTLQRKEAFEVHRQHLDVDAALIDDEVLTRLRQGGDVSTDEYAHADAVRRRFTADVIALLEDHDVLALPTTPTVAPTVGQRRVVIAGTSVEVRGALLSLTSPWNLVGVPALSVPAGRVDGLPFGLQLVTRTGHESMLFSTAAQLSAPDARHS